MQQPVAQLPWGHVTVLLDRLGEESDRLWYAAAAAEHGWSRSVLDHQIRSGLRQRSGTALTNFDTHLPRADSDLAQELVKDTYIFDFLGLTERATERDLENAMMEHIRETLMELGPGLSLVGRQVRFEVAGDEFFVDLLLFHVEQLRYVVVELKVTKFKFEYAGQLGGYVAIVDDQRRIPEIHAPTVGILICADRNEQVVRYALRSTTAPMAVTTYTYDALPPAEQAALPADEAITAAFTPRLSPENAASLLKDLRTVNPHLDHRRSIDRARNTWWDIQHRKDPQTVLRNVAYRFSNGTTVQLTEHEASRVLHIIRQAYDREGFTDPTT